MNKEIIKEFREKYDNDEFVKAKHLGYETIYVNPDLDLIADFWLSKLDQQKQDLLKKVKEKEKIKEMVMKEYIFKFDGQGSLEDDTITTVVAENIEKAENKARKKVKEGKAREISDIWEIKNSERIKILWLKG